MTPHQSIWASFKPYFRYPGLNQRVAASVHQIEIAAAGRAYGFPVPKGPSTVGIIELGGGYTERDLDLAIPGLGGRTTAVSVDGATNSPGSDADGEVLLDTQIIGVLNPLAKLRVVFAQNQDASFANAVIRCVDDGCDAISISWGGPEKTWTDQGIMRMESAFNYAKKHQIPVFCASGDNDADDGTGTLQVDYPASSPHAISCGGTRLRILPGGVLDETVWNDGTAMGGTGGGLSQRFKVPQAAHLTYRYSNGLPTSLLNNRGVPDVAGNADPVSGWLIYQDGIKRPIGGTSAVAPMWAALFSILKSNGLRTENFGDLLYGLNAKAEAEHVEHAFHPITRGNNSVYEGSSNKMVLRGFAAGPGNGWNACTGLGSPNGMAMSRLLGVA